MLYVDLTIYLLVMTGAGFLLSGPGYILFSLCLVFNLMFYPHGAQLVGVIFVSG